MDRIFDRLGDLLRSFLHEESPFDSHEEAQYADEDMREAWEELNDFLKDEQSPFYTGSSGFGSRVHEKYQNDGRFTYGRKTTGGGSSYGTYTKGTHKKRVPEDLRSDFETLGVPFGAPFETVRSNYKKLLRKHHPDKHAEDKKVYEKATQYTQKINYSFARIKNFYES